MNTYAVSLTGIAAAIALLTLLFSWTFKKETVEKVRQTITWLLKISFFDFVQLIIFIKPWKKYFERIGIVVWLVLVLVTGRYLITAQPKLSEIAGPYIPMIGYIYYLTALFIIHFMLLVSRKAD
jgi:hypothetical protein